MHYTQALLALYFTIGAQALTYWVSPECDGKGFNEEVMDEVRKMGVEGRGRLNSDDNENMAYAFKTIFKVEKSDEAARTKVSSKWCNLLQSGTYERTKEGVSDTKRHGYN
jgi:hypothetical protein